MQIDTIDLVVLEDAQTSWLQLKKLHQSYKMQTYYIAFTKLMATYLRCIASLKPTISSLPETKSLHDWKSLSSSQPRRGLAVVFFSWYLFTNQRGKPLSGSWSSISWTWQVQSVTYNFQLDWQNTAQIGNLSHIQKWKTLQMSKDMPMARCCIFPPKSGKTTFTKKKLTSKFSM